MKGVFFSFHFILLLKESVKKSIYFFLLRQKNKKKNILIKKEKTFVFDRPFIRHSSRASRPPDFLVEVAAAAPPTTAFFSAISRVSSFFPSPNTSRFGEQWPPCPLPPELPPPADPALASPSDRPIASRSPCLFPRFVSRLVVLSRWTACLCLFCLLSL